MREGVEAVLPLLADLEVAGFSVVAQADGCGKLVQAALACAPDVVVGEVVLPTEALFEATLALAEALPCPVLLFTQDADAGHMARAVMAGVHGWVVNGYGAQRLSPLVQLAQARFAHEQALRAQLLDVTQRLDDRKVVERAKGILMRAREVSDDGAFEILRMASMHSNQRLGQVSQHIVDAAHWADAVNRAGQLRMLSQRLVKLHLLHVADPKSRTTLGLLVDSRQRVDGNLAWLEKSFAQPEFGEPLRALATTWLGLKNALEARPTAAGVPLVEGLAERLLEDAERLTAGLQAGGAVASLQVLNAAGRQRMLSQRFAKLALMALLEVPESGGDRGETLAQVRGDFERSMAYLNGLPLSTPAIREMLDDAARGWQQLLTATPLGQRPAGRDRLSRLETVAQSSEILLDVFERLSTQYERSMQTLMG